MWWCLHINRLWRDQIETAMFFHISQVSIHTMKSWYHYRPPQPVTGGRSGVSVYKAGRSVPLDSAQLDLSRLALPRLGSAGVEKCFEIHVPSSGLKTQKNGKRPKMHFTNRIRALAANLLQNVVRQETTRILVPSPSFPNAQKSKHRFFFYTTACCMIGSAKRRPKSTYLPQVWKHKQTEKRQTMQLTNRIRALGPKMRDPKMN